MTSQAFNTFAEKLAVLETTASRLEMTKQLAQLFLLLDRDEIPATCYLMQGSLVPEYERLEFQLSATMVVKALAQFADEKMISSSNTTASLEELKKRYKQVGDIGELAEAVVSEYVGGNNVSEQSNQVLSILEVFELLTKIAQESGSGSQQRKLDSLVALLKMISPLSARFIARIVVGRLRLGFSTMTLLDALSWAIHGDKSDTAQLEAAFNRRADIGFLAQQYLQPGLSTAERTKMLNSIQVTLGIPVVPALCQRLNSASEIIEKMEAVYAEPKYDGLRIQIHFDKAQRFIRAYTRNLDDISHMFPELEVAFDAFNADQLIVDGEAIGYDPATDSLRSFQETITRRRKHDVAQQAGKIPIRFYVYDVMFANGSSKINESMQDRKDLLIKVIKNNEVFLQTPYIQTNDPIELRTFHEEQLALGFEGAVIKKIDSPYVSGRKGWNWVKIKEEEGTTGKLSDTLDCVVLGYYFGRGKRAQFGLGALLVGVRDEATDSLQTVAKIGTGLSEQQLVELKNLCDEHSVAQVPQNHQIPKELMPDVITEASIVLEIAADEITHSPLHSAGVALRFPRLIRIRTDKSPEQATTRNELEGLNLPHLKMK